MSLQVLDNVRQELIKLVPSSAFEDVACFVFYDNHPRDEKFIDVTICTTGGEIIEYYKREVVCSFQINCTSKPADVKILRNGNCELFYLVAVGDDVLIISRREKLRLHRQVGNVDKYEIEDSACRGQACLKIIRKDDAVPMVFDDNFENLGDKAMVLSCIHAGDSLPILTQLMRKLTETKYSVKCNEKTLNEFLSLRQMSALSSYQQNRPNNSESVFQDKLNGIATDTALDIKTQTPWVKFCNKRIIVMLTLSYTSNEPLEDMHILLHGTSKLSMVYTTRLFQKINAPPFWKEKNARVIKSDPEIAITAVINFSEIKHVVTNKIEFNGAIFYKKGGKEYLVPFDHVFISGEEVFEKQYDVLMCDNLDEMTCLAILASTTRTEMRFRHIRKEGDPHLELPELLCTHLHMEMVHNASNVIIYRNSPYHVLNGVMLIFEKDVGNTDVYNVSMCTRSPSQITSLMYYVHITIPHQIVITTRNQRITAKRDTLARYNEGLTIPTENMKHVDYSAAILNQSKKVLEYLDVCLMEMGKSRDAENNDLIGTEVDLLGPGFAKYNEFKQFMMDESYKGIKSYAEETEK